MDPEISSPPIASYLKSRPFIPISFALSVAALGFGAFSLLHLPSQTSLAPGFVPVDEQVLSATTSIAVDVEGEVARPGLLLVETSSNKPLRIADVIEKAGGLLPTADSEYIQKNINLASIVTDGMKVYVPKKGEITTQAINGASTSTGKVNVNTATLSQLQTLAGIGESRAQAIIGNRPYGSLEDLGTKAKLSSALLEKIKHDIVF